MTWRQGRAGGREGGREGGRAANWGRAAQHDVAEPICHKGNPVTRLRCTAVDIHPTHLLRCPTVCSMSEMKQYAVHDMYTKATVMLEHIPKTTDELQLARCQTMQTMHAFQSCNVFTRLITAQAHGDGCFGCFSDCGFGQPRRGR